MRLIALVACVVLALLVPAAAQAAGRVVLGTSTGPYQHGLGHPHPSSVGYGGLGTSDMFQMHWSHSRRAAPREAPASGGSRAAGGFLRRHGGGGQPPPYPPPELRRRARPHLLPLPAARLAEQKARGSAVGPVPPLCSSDLRGGRYSD